MADPTVDIIAHPTGINLPTPQTNSALQLASSLAGVNEALGPALDGVAHVLQQRQAAKAEADALANSGQAFADAVKAGTLRPTQNPWYLQAYSQKAAAVRAQGQGAQLMADSQTWAEKNDPTAFNTKWQTEVGKIAQGYTSPLEMSGFKAAMDPISQQALNTNVEYNAQQIEQKNVQNTTQLMSSAIENVYKANPKAGPAEYFAKIQPLLNQWHSTGGTEPQANLLIKGAFEAAAANSGDGDILDNLKYDRGDGKGSIYNIVSANGQSNAEDIETTRYHVARMQEMAGMGAIRKEQNTQELEGYSIQKWAYAKYGADLMNSKIPFQQIMTDAQAQGFTLPGVQAFFRIESRDLTDNDAYMSAQVRQYTKDPSNQPTILQLRTEAHKSGWSPALEARVWEQVRNGMDEGTANEILTAADSTDKYNRSEAKAEVRDTRAQANFDRAQRQQANHDFKQSVMEHLSTIDGVLQGVNDRSLITNPAYRTTVTRGLTDAGNSYLRQHPDDYAGAEGAMDAWAGRELNRKRRLIGGPSGGTNAGGLQLGNPRGGQ